MKIWFGHVICQNVGNALPVLEGNSLKFIIFMSSDVNPIRSGLFQTTNDPGGGGFKSPPPTISKTILSIFTISYMCLLPGVLGMFQLEFFKNSRF